MANSLKTVKIAELFSVVTTNCLTHISSNSSSVTRHEYTKQIATWRAARCYSDVAIVHHSRFCKANRNMAPGSPARTKIRDVTQWSLYKSILPKNMAASKSDVTSAVLN